MSHTPYIIAAFSFAFSVLAILTVWTVRSDRCVRRLLKRYESDDL
jgi:hypothetical protein